MNSSPAGHDTAKGIWVGTERIGDAYNMYWSNDGKVWTKVGSTNLALPADALAGVEATAATPSRRITKRLERETADVE